MTTVRCLEFGNHLGNLAPLLIGAAPGDVFMVPDKQHEAAAQVRAAGYVVLRAPRLGGELRVGEVVSYAGLMLRAGYGWGAGRQVGAHVRRWCDLLRDAGASSIVSSHAPAALLAAQRLDLPARRVGAGFTAPPADLPAWSAHGAVSPAAARVAGVHRAQLVALLAPLGVDPIEAHARAACTVHGSAALDPYAPRAVDYAPPAPLSDAPVRWPQGGGPRVLVYLRDPAMAGPIARALARLRCRVLFRTDDGAVREVKRWYRQGFSVWVDAINMPRAVSEADAVIGYGSPGLLAECLHYGKPALMFPVNGDQVLATSRASRLGAIEAAQPYLLHCADELVRGWLDRALPAEAVPG